jgi:hypothetical protein
MPERDVVIQKIKMQRWREAGDKRRANKANVALIL